MEKRRLSNATDRRRRETEGERSERGRGRREEIANLYFLLQNVAIEKTTLFFAPSIVSFVLSKNFFRVQSCSREMTEVATLFSSFEGFPFKHGGREVSIWSRDPLGGFSCKSFLATWLILLPLVCRLFLVLWRIKIPRKLSSLLESLTRAH